MVKILQSCKKLKTAFHNGRCWTSLIVGGITAVYDKYICIAIQISIVIGSFTANRHIYSLEYHQLSNLFCFGHIIFKFVLNLGFTLLLYIFKVAE